MGNETKTEKSPGKTSDYESDSSRSVTPNTDPSRSNSPSKIKTEGKETAVKTEEVSSEPAKSEGQEEGVSDASGDNTKVAVKREVKKEASEDDELDIFASATEEDEDKDGVQAAVMTGLLSEDVKEEERVAEETLRMERQEEAKRKQEMAKEAEMLSTQQRFERLQKLLGKSKFYSDFLLNKMKSHEAAMELKKQVQEGRVKKRESMAKTTEEPAKGKKRGRKKNDQDGPKSKKMKLGEEATETTDQ